jgi:hypothetical protein
MFFNRYLNDYVSELIGLERGLVVHLVVGIHVADVAVGDQVHVTSYYFNSNQRKLPSRASRALIFNKSELIFTIVMSTVQNWCQNASN